MPRLPRRNKVSQATVRDSNKETTEMTRGTDAIRVIMSFITTSGRTSAEKISRKRLHRYVGFLFRYCQYL